MNKQLLAGYIAAAALVATPMVAKWEGKRNDPYRDIVGVQTVCYGETRVEMRRYSDAECEAMLAAAVRGFTGDVLSCVPQLAGRPYQTAAAASLAYNIGSASFCRSTAARLFRQGAWAEGCHALGAYVYAGGQPSRGLKNRRADEVRLCLLDVD